MRTRRASDAKTRRHVSRPKRARPTTGAWAHDVLALHLAPTLGEFIQQAFEVLPRIVSCDFVSAIYRRGGGGLVEEGESLGRTRGKGGMRRYLGLTPAIPAVLSRPGTKVVATRHEIRVDDATLRRTAFYREVMRPQGWRHAVSLCFWADPPVFPIFVLTLNRRARRPDFSRNEIARLERLHEY